PPARPPPPPPAHRALAGASRLLGRASLILHDEDGWTVRVSPDGTFVPERWEPSSESMSQRYTVTRDRRSPTGIDWIWTDLEAGTSRNVALPPESSFHRRPLGFFGDQLVLLELDTLHAIRF